MKFKQHSKTMETINEISKKNKYLNNYQNNNYQKYKD